MREFQKFSWATAGFVFGWFAAGWIGLSTFCDPASAVLRGGECRIVKFLFDWQGLIAGFAAIGAALIGGNYILKQIELSKEQAGERIRSRHAAARSMLPLALASITQYTAECARELKKLHLASKGDVVPKSALEALVVLRNYRLGLIEDMPRYNELLNLTSNNRQPPEPLR